MARLGLARAGWLGIVLALLAAVATTPCLAQAQQDTPDQQALLAAINPLSAPAPLAAPAMFATSPAGDAPVSLAVDDRGRALDCMGMAIAYEAAGQPVAGQEAVGQVILNRLRAARFPKTVCGVVFQGSARVTGCQFTFTCDGSFRRRLADTTLVSARSIAASVLDGVAPDRVAGATNYHADYVQPYWAASGQRVARIGAHIFYRMPGDGWQGAQSALLTPLSVGRHRSRFGPQAVPAAPHALFAPWGLAVGAVVQH